MKSFTTEKQKLGELGEDIACMFLMKRGFDIIERNLTRKYGEIDILARREGITHFIEVKSMKVFDKKGIVAHETNWAMQNMTLAKQKKFRKMVGAIIKDKLYDIKDFYIDVILVSLRMRARIARVEWLQNVSLA